MGNSTGKSSEFVANMERVLDVYKRPNNPENPVICMDEPPRQLIAEGRPSPMETVQIYSNATVCNSVGEVEASCGLGIDESTVSNYYCTKS